MRTCRCGCSRSLSGMHGRYVWHPLCSHKSRLARRQREKAKKKIERQHRPKPTWGEPAREPEHKCRSCAGIPYARVVDRLDCFGKSVGRETPWGVVCYRCLQPYAPERPRRIQGVIGSSAGTAAMHGSLYGAEMMK